MSCDRWFIAGGHESGLWAWWNGAATVAKRKVPPNQGSFKSNAAWVGAVFDSFDQRRGLRYYLAVVLAQRGRNKMPPALAGAEPFVLTQAVSAQRLRHVMSEAHWEAHALAARPPAVKDACAMAEAVTGRLPSSQEAKKILFEL